MLCPQSGTEGAIEIPGLVYAPLAPFAAISELEQLFRFAFERFAPRVFDANGL